MSHYEYVIAGLPELKLDEARVKLSRSELLGELKQELSKEDHLLVELLLLKYDNSNLLLLNQGKPELFEDKGNYSQIELEDILQVIKQGGIPEGAPSYWVDFLKYPDENKSHYKVLDDLLNELYYRYGMQSENDFVRLMFEFEMNIKNTEVALNSRNHQMDYKPLVLQGTSVSEVISNNNSRDLGLPFIFPTINEVAKAMEESDVYRREQKLARIRWQYIEESASSYYFTIESVLSYYLKFDILDRWNAITQEKGEKEFRTFTKELANSFTFPERFLLK